MSSDLRIGEAWGRIWITTKHAAKFSLSSHRGRRAGERIPRNRIPRIQPMNRTTDSPSPLKGERAGVRGEKVREASSLEQRFMGRRAIASFLFLRFSQNPIDVWRGTGYVAARDREFGHSTADKRSAAKQSGSWVLT